MKKNKNRSRLAGKRPTVFSITSTPPTREEVQQRAAQHPIAPWSESLCYEATEEGRRKVERMGFFHALAEYCLSMRAAYTKLEDATNADPDTIIRLSSVDEVQKMLPEKITLLFLGVAQEKPPISVADEQHFRTAYTTGFLEGYRFFLFAVEHGVMPMFQDFTHEEDEKILQAFVWSVYTPDVDRLSDLPYTMRQAVEFLQIYHRCYLDGFNPEEVLGVART